MAIKYFSNIESLAIDMQQNVLSNVVIHPLTTATRPTSPTVGQTVYNGTLKALEVWDGANWVSASGDITDIIAGVGLSGGGTVGSITLDLDFSELTDMTADITGDTEFILLDGTTESRKAASEIKLSNFENDQNWSSTVGTVTSIGITGNDGINVSGSPITSDGVITLGIDNSSITNDKLVNNTITIGTTVISLGSTSTLLNGLTSLDFAAGDRTIGASIGANSLTLAGQTSTIVIPGNLQVVGTTTTNNVETVSTSNGVVFEGNVALDNIALTLLAGTLTENRTITLPDATGTIALLDDINDAILTVEGTNGLTGSGTFTANDADATTITISHADTSTQASVDNSGLTVIQDVTLDDYGHVTGLTSSDLTNEVNTLITAKSGSIAVPTSATYTYPNSMEATSTNNVLIQLVDSNGETVHADVQRLSTTTFSVAYGVTEPTGVIALIQLIG